MKKLTKFWTKCLSNNTFHLPVLGPVFSLNNDKEKIIIELLKNSQTDKFLSYDKNKRWFKKKMENIDLFSIDYNDEEIYIPAIDSLRNTLKVYYYSKKIPTNLNFKKALEISNKLNKKINKIQFFCYKKPRINRSITTHNIYLKKISKIDKLKSSSKSICFFNKLDKDIQNTFIDFATEPELDNFLTLMDKKFKNKLDSTLCSVYNKKIIGAIGPLEVVSDPWRISFLFPPNFGVSEKMRNQGIGEQLWKNAMNEAQNQGAKYTLVQNTPDSPAAKFYEKQGLIVGAQVYSLFL